MKPDNTYEVRIDGSKVESGDLESDWDFLPPKKIKDPEAKKPEDWDDKPKIDDPEDSKPEVCNKYNVNLMSECGISEFYFAVGPVDPFLYLPNEQVSCFLRKICKETKSQKTVQ